MKSQIEVAASRTWATASAAPANEAAVSDESKQESPSPATIPNPLYLYDGKKLVMVDRTTLLAEPSKQASAAKKDNGNAAAELEHGRQFSKFDGPVADSLIQRASILSPLKGQQGVYINPEGKVVIERGSDVHKIMVNVLRTHADDDARTNAEKQHWKTAVKVGATVLGSGTVTAMGAAAVTGGAAAIPAEASAIAAAAAAVVATAIYLNAKGALSHSALEQRISNLEKFGKLDTASNMSQRIGHYFDNSFLRTLALCVKDSADDTLEAYEVIAANNLLAAPKGENQSVRQ